MSEKVHLPVVPCQQPMRAAQPAAVPIRTRQQQAGARPFQAAWGPRTAAIGVGYDDSPRCGQWIDTYA